MAVKPPIMPILREEAERNGYTIEQILEHNHERRVKSVRHYAMWRARVETGRPYTEIARAFNRDHSTVIHAVQKVDAMQAEQRSDFPESRKFPVPRLPASTFMGNDCKHGHGGLRYVSSGQCVKCKLTSSARRYYAKKAAE